MMHKIDEARAAGDSLGGVFELIITGVPTGLGSHAHWDRKLDGKLAAALMSVQAIKGVEIGAGFGVANRPGSLVHDEIFWSRKEGFFRKTNMAGGIEGGMSNGGPIVASRRHEADPHAHEAASLRRHREQEALQGGRRAFRRLRRASCRRGGRGRWWPSRSRRP